MAQALGDGGQRAVDKILQPAGRRFPVCVDFRVDDDDSPVVTLAEQLRLRLQQLRPIWIHNILAVHPIPAPDEQLRGPAAQPRLDQRNSFIRGNNDALRFANVSPFFVIADDKHVLRADKLRAFPLVAVIPDIQSDAPGVLGVYLFELSLRREKARSPVRQTIGDRLPAAAGCRSIAGWR